MKNKGQHLDTFFHLIKHICTVASIWNICTHSTVFLQRKALTLLWWHIEFVLAKSAATPSRDLCKSSRKNPSSLHILPVALGKALPGVTGPPPHPDFKRLYLRGWHSSPRQCHTPARPGGLHMYTLSNHPSVTWVTSRSCCSAGGLCIGSDWWKGRKQKERKQRNMVHVHVGNEFMCTDEPTPVWEEWWGVCICSLVTSFSTTLQMSLFSATANLTRTTSDEEYVEFKDVFRMKRE